MKATAVTTLKLAEFRPVSFQPEAFSEAEALELDRIYSVQVDVQYPSPRTNGEYRLTNRGWVGFLPLSSGRVVELTPKVPLANLFRMLEYAYGLKSFAFLDGLVDCATLADLYQRLAGLLARKVRSRLRRGVYRRYVSREERLTCIRGRLDVTDLMVRGWEVGRQCGYQEHTSNVDENSLLAWTLGRVLRSGLCTEPETAALVRSAYRELLAVCEVRPFTAEDCRRFHYSRLNEDYRSLHALCRFFLENSGPTIEKGSRSMVPFRVDMARLFERFVAEWLRVHLTDEVVVCAQESLWVGGPVSVEFVADVVLRRADTLDAVMVLDTKYKLDVRPQASDLEQVVAYAAGYGGELGVLVYPQSAPEKFVARVGPTKATTIGVGLDMMGSDSWFGRLAGIGDLLAACMPATTHNPIS